MVESSYNAIEDSSLMCSRDVVRRVDCTPNFELYTLHNCTFNYHLHFPTPAFIYFPAPATSTSVVTRTNSACLVRMQIITTDEDPWIGVETFG